MRAPNTDLAVIPKLNHGRRPGTRYVIIHVMDGSLGEGILNLPNGPDRGRLWYTKAMPGWTELDETQRRLADCKSKRWELHERLAQAEKALEEIQALTNLDFQGSSLRLIDEIDKVARSYFGAYART